MIRALFALTLVVALVVNILFLFTAKDKPPDLASPLMLTSPLAQQAAAAKEPASRRLFLRSDDFYSDDELPAKRNTTTSELNNTGRNHRSWNLSADGRRASETHGRSLMQNPDESSGRLGANESLSNRLDEGTGTTPKGNNDQSGTATAAKASQIAESSTPAHEFQSGVDGSATIEVPDVDAHGPWDKLNSGPTINKLGASKLGIDNDDLSEKQAKTISIRVKSSKDHVFVSVNNLVIYESKSTRSLLHRSRHRPTASDDSQPNDGRGIHCLVLNQFDGSLMASRLFDTYSPNQDEELSHFLGLVRDGRILVLAVKDEASFKMAPSSSGRLLLEALGSRQIMRLGWRDMWAMVVVKRTKTEVGRQLGERVAGRRRDTGKLASDPPAAEALSKAPRFGDWAPAVQLQSNLALAEPSENEECHWNSGDPDEDQRRAAFCGQIEGYGQLCDCRSPAPITFKPQKLEQWQLNEVPILVMASNRPYYLYRMLRSLLTTHGLNQSAVSVFIDGFYEEPLAVARLFKLRAIQQQPRGSRSGRISHHYKSSLAAAFQLFPRAQFAIIFEEDLDVAKDALVYFNQTMGLLREDPSLYCVSAWNDQGYEHTARDPRLVYRIETMPGLGWMLSRRLFELELQPQWPTPEQAHDWDMWIRTEQVRRGRECLIPDVSRTFHFGSSGTNINSYFQRQYFSKHAFNLVSESRFGPELEELSREAYERHIERLIRGANHLLGSPIAGPRNQTNATELLCSMATAQVQGGQLLASSYDNLVTEPQQSLEASDTNVIFISMIDRHDFGNWLKLAKCWKIWDLDPRGQHNSMWRLFLAGRHTLVIGSPASPYAKLKPHDLAPFELVS